LSGRHFSLKEMETEHIYRWQYSPSFIMVRKALLSERDGNLLGIL